MKPVQWISENEFVVDDVRFLCSLDDYSRKTDQDRIIILKDRGSLSCYSAALNGAQIQNVLEFGVLEGGSAVLFTLLLGLEKFVGIEIRDSCPGLKAFLSRHEAGKKIKLHLGTSQVDEPKVRDIITSEFKGAPIDLIIDDASHEYALTKKTFEIAFPQLKPGGLYVIEDWGWPHWKGCKAFEGKPAMSMLIFELLMLCATNRKIISDIHINSGFAFIRKSREATHLPDFSIDKTYQKRDLYLTFRDFQTECEARSRELEAMRATTAWRMHEAMSKLKNGVLGKKRSSNAQPGGF